MQTTDNELIYLYKTENLHYAKEILFGRYNEKLTNITKYYVRNTFPSIDLSSNEIRSLVYLSIEKAIKKFDLSQKSFNYAQSLYTINHSLIAHYCWKQISSGNKILDSSYSLDQNIETNNGNLSYLVDEKPSIMEKTIQEIDTDCFKDFISFHIKTKNQNLLQKVIQYKLLGYKNQEIAQKMNLSVIQIVNIYHYFVVNAKKCILNNESLLKIFDKCKRCKW